MLEAETIPETATFYQEEKGVRWYIDGQGVNALHIMVFDGRMLTGSWAVPRAVFWALTSMTPAVRTRYRTDDAFMGAINTRLAQRKRKERER